ncbi:hypothetical protein RRG08_018481, partial [Elysia crispata]
HIFDIFLGPVHPFYDPPLDEHLCQEILWPLGDGQVPQQCKRRPRAGRDRCWQHDPRTRSGATARRQEAVKARRAAEERRLAELRQRERRKQYENRRFGFPRGALPDPPDLPNSFQQLAPTDFILIQDTPVDVSLADVEDILRQVDETPLDTRREFLPPAVSSFLDNHVARAMRERGFMTDTRRRQYDVAMYGINNRYKDYNFPHFPNELSTELESPQLPPIHLSIELVSPQFPPAGYLSIELVSPQFPPAGYLSIELVSPQFPPAGYLCKEFVSPQFPPAGYLSKEFVSPQFPPAGYLSIELVSPQSPPAGYLSIDFQLLSLQFPSKCLNSFKHVLNVFYRARTK